MPKITVSQTFVGSPEEMEKYGGQVPASMKKEEKKMGAGERESFRGKITAGTIMEVDDKRAQELKDLGFVQGFDKKEAPAGPNILQAASIPKGKTAEKGTDKLNVKEKAETKKAIPTQKKQK